MKKEVGDKKVVIVNVISIKKEHVEHVEDGAPRKYIKQTNN